jgi:hypothetical protein
MDELTHGAILKTFQTSISLPYHATCALGLLVGMASHDMEHTVDYN